jgi:hypothetical protein
LVLEDPVADRVVRHFRRGHRLKLPFSLCRPDDDSLTHS